MCTAFGGSLDQKTDPINIVISEVREEAGFVVTEADIAEVGRMFVSTQSNQFCNLYIVYVEGSKQLDCIPENDLEAMSTVMWVDEGFIMSNCDWKSIVILSKLKELDEDS
jgi:hypothetical protein